MAGAEVELANSSELMLRLDAISLVTAPWVVTASVLSKESMPPEIAFATGPQLLFVPGLQLVAVLQRLSEPLPVQTIAGGIAAKF